MGGRERGEKEGGDEGRVMGKGYREEGGEGRYEGGVCGRGCEGERRAWRKEARGVGSHYQPVSLGFCSVFLGNIKEAFDKNPNLQNLLLDDFFKTAILRCQVTLPVSHSLVVHFFQSKSFPVLYKEVPHI